VIFLAIAFIAFTVVTIGCYVAAWVAWRRGNYEWVLFALLSVVFTFLWLILAALATGGVSDVPDGCYRISSTSSVGIVSTGKTVTPVVLSGKTYTPISCGVE
jgi:hypothetical protein